MNSSIPKEALDEYIAETRELCDRVSGHLGQMDRGPTSDETLNSIYRDMHSIKGGSHLFGFRKIGDLAHCMEAALDSVRNKSIILDSKIIDALFSGLDLIGKMVASILVSGLEGDENEALLLEIISRIEAITAQNPKRHLDVKKVDPLQTTEKNLTLEAHANHEMPHPKRPEGLHIESTLNQGVDSEKKNIVGKEEAVSDASTIRIGVGLLDQIMNLVGELVLIRNQFLQIDQKGMNVEFKAASHRLNAVTSELQTDVMKTRMQPIGSVLSKFQRVVRDVSRDLGKKVQLKLEGLDTELDKTLVEAVKDPLMHLVRNSLDHGIERPDVRIKAGKPEEGTLKVRSFHEGGHIFIEIHDDGGGISAAKIGAAALEKGFITKEKLLQLSEHEVRSLIFTPGFSTAEKVSNLSGRGVGMDVVKTNIEKIGGSIELQSVEGKGTTITLKIPLTLAIIPALIVRSKESVLAFPQIKVVELLRIDRDRSDHACVEVLQGVLVYRLRGRILPLLCLSNILGETQLSSQEIANTSINNIVVLQGDRDQFGLVVHEISDNSDIVVKPINHLIKNIGIYSGATILGDGSVVLIADVHGLAVVGNVQDKRTEDFGGVISSGGSKNVETIEYLFVKLHVPGRFAIPLQFVNRLETFSKSQVEWTGSKRVIRYRDGILPLISMNLPGVKLNLDSKSSGFNESIQTVVVTSNGRLFGIEVEEIIDIGRLGVNIDDAVTRSDRILGSVIQGNDIFSILDIASLLSDFGPLTLPAIDAHSIK